MINIIKSLKIFLSSILITLILSSCGIYKKTDQRGVPSAAKDRARENLKTGSGASINKILGRNKGNGNFEFSSSNPLWRASLEILDFLPLATVDYSGGVLITDWYNDSQDTNESLKITIRFLSNEVRSDSIKIIVHRKNCINVNSCKISVLNSKIKTELTSSILSTAVLLKKEVNNKKK